MPRRGAKITQADIARVVRAYGSEGVKVRTRWMPDGSIVFDPIEGSQQESVEAVPPASKEILL